MRIRKIAGLVLVVTTSACASKGGALRHLEARVDSVAVTRICGVLAAVEIEDSRESISDRAIRVPLATTGREFDAVRPRLGDELQEIIRSELARRFSGQGPEVSAQVRVLEGVQRFRARRLSEVESAHWNTEVILSRAGRTTSGLSEAEHFVRSIDASRSFSDTLSRRVLRLSVAEAFTDAAAPHIVSEDPTCSSVHG